MHFISPIRHLNSNFKLFPLLLAIFCTVEYVICSNRANYREFCDNKSVRCESKASLTCQNSTCLCMKPDSMTYDPSRKVCVSLAGEKCKFTVVEVIEYRSSWHEEVSCVNNSRCNTHTGICTCDPTFMEHPNGSCVPRRGYGETCKDDLECRSDMHLSCVNSQCKCDQDGAIYSYSHSQCVGLADKPCLNDLCTANALCRGYYGGHTMDSYEEYSGEDTKCVCSPGYTMSPKGLCQVGHGGSCDFRDSQCLDNFKCQDGTCVCKYKGHQVYDEYLQDCYSLVGGPCTLKGQGLQQQGQQEFHKGNNVTSPRIYCTKPAVCVQSGRFSHQCVCPEGTVESQDRRCELTFGRICQPDKDRAGNYNSNSNSHTNLNVMKCDHLAPLFCIDGKCQCEDDLKAFDDIRKKCRGLVGSECNAEEDNFCVDGAYCAKYRGSKVKGQCKCMEDYQDFQNRTCFPVGNEINFVV